MRKIPKFEAWSMRRLWRPPGGRRVAHRGSPTDGAFRYASGFSLVEVTIALGIFSFALISILGLMSGSIGMNRDSLEKSASAQIADYVLGGLGRTSFSDLGDDQEYFFDDAGTRLSNNSSKAIYTARVRFGEVKLQPSSSPVSSNLKRVAIEVRSVRNPASPQKFSYLLFNQGR